VDEGSVDGRPDLELSISQSCLSEVTSVCSWWRCRLWQGRTISAQLGSPYLAGRALTSYDHMFLACSWNVPLTS